MRFLPLLVFLVACRHFDVEETPPDAAAIAKPWHCGIASGSAAARGALWYANHSSQELLESQWPMGPGLAAEVAAELVALRPLSKVSELEAISGAECGDVVEVACLIYGRCEDAMRIATWNLRTFPLSAETPAIAHALIEELELDIVGLQEIADTSTFFAMRDALPGFGGFPGRPGFATRVAILYREDRFAIADIEDLFVDDSFAFPRPPLAVTFSLKNQLAQAEPALFTVVVLHLKAMLNDESVARRRLAMSRLHGWASQRPEPIMFIGDFNDRLDDPVEDDVFEPFRTDEYALLTEDLATAGAYSYIRYRSLIDHSVASASLQEFLPVEQVSVPALEETVHDFEKRVSDHRPVITEHWPIRASNEAAEPLAHLPWTP
jgi:endonuclease/exonuclease/phosphatase family metal-dependent hydrolase